MNPSAANRLGRARFRNHVLGGDLGSEADQQLLNRLDEVAPGFRHAVDAEAAFIERAWRYLHRKRGIRQAVYRGAPLSIGRPPHHVAREAGGYRDQGTVVYVEPDEQLATQDRKRLVDHEDVQVIHADLFKAAAVFDHDLCHLPIAPETPIAVFLPGELGDVDENQATQILHDLRLQLAPGSFVVASQGLLSDTAEDVAVVRKLQKLPGISSTGYASFRTYAEIKAPFQGFDLLYPHVTTAGKWWPGGPSFREPTIWERLVGVVVAQVKSPSP